MVMIDTGVLVAIDSLLEKKLEGKHYDIISSFKSYYERHGKLTERQASYLASLVDRYSESTEEWVNSFDEEKRNTFKMAVAYYFKTPYFQEVVKKCYLNKDFIPSRRQYEKMCQNKYFLRALENYKTPPKYEVGDMICWRKSIYRGQEPCVGLVESVSDAPSYHHGDRRYTILWLHDGNRLETSERSIKLYRESKNKPTENTDEV